MPRANPFVADEPDERSCEPRRGTIGTEQFLYKRPAEQQIDEIDL